MPPPELSDRFQDAVLWAKVSDNRYSEPVVEQPVELVVRWENVAAESITPDGKVIRLDAMVSVDQDVAMGSIMYEGSLDLWLGTGSAGVDDQLMEVVTKQVTPDVKGREVDYMLGLVRFKGELPEVV